MASPQNLSELQFPLALVEELNELVDRPIRVMVICGTQTRTLLKYSDEDILPEDLEIEEASAQAEAADALTRWDHQIPDERADGTISPVPEADPEPMDPSRAGAIAAEPIQTAAATFEELSTAVPISAAAVRSHRPLSGLIAAMALLTPMYLFLADGQSDQFQV